MAPSGVTPWSSEKKAGIHRPLLLPTIFFSFLQPHIHTYIYIKLSLSSFIFSYTMSAKPPSRDNNDSSDSRGRRRSSAAAQLLHLRHGSPRQQEAVKEIEEMFRVSSSQLNALVRGFKEEMQAGLADDTQAQPLPRSSDLKMIPSFVTGIRPKWEL